MGAGTGDARRCTCYTWRKESVNVVTTQAPPAAVAGATDTPTPPAGSAPDDDLISLGAAAAILGTSRSPVYRLIDSGDLEGVPQEAGAVMVRRAAVIALRTRIDEAGTAVTLAEAARRLGVHRTSIYRMIERGELAAVRHPLHAAHGHVLIARAAIDALLRRRGAKSAPRMRRDEAGTPTSTGDDLVSFAAAAELLGASRTRVYGLVRDGKLAPIRNPLYGKKGPVWFRRADVERLREPAG
jgi:excisionase family DNA binding protein